MLSSRFQYYNHKIYVTPFREKAGDDSERTRSSCLEWKKTKSWTKSRIDCEHMKLGEETHEPVMVFVTLTI